MKRSRIFLGLTTSCLAIAGVVAAKVSHFSDPRTAYYVPPASSSCLPTKVTCVFDANQTPICTIHSGLTVFTDNGCTQQLKYNSF